MSLALTRLTPGVQCVIDDHALSQYFVVVREIVGQPKGDSQQFRRLWREFKVIGVGAAHDDCEAVQGRVRQIVLAQKGVEAAQRPRRATTRHPGCRRVWRLAHAPESLPRWPAHKRTPPPHR